MGIPNEESHYGQRLVARADAVVSLMHLICRHAALVSWLALATVLAAMCAGTGHRIALAACMVALCMQGAHVTLHIMARVVRRQLTAFRERMEARDRR